MATAYLTLIQNAEWLPIVDRVLGGDETARSVTWLQTSYFVERRLRLPLGPLSNDEDVRRDIAVKVLAKLEANDRAHLREWRQRQERRRDHASWWSLIKRVAVRVAIDYCRTSRRNVARRGENFAWVDVQLADPHTLADSVDQVQIPNTPGEIYELLREVQRRRRNEREQASPAVIRRSPGRVRISA